MADQLFKLKFQMNMGQTESLKKIRGLRRDIARVKTVLREQELAAEDADQDGEKIMAEITGNRKKRKPKQRKPKSTRAARSDRHSGLEQDAEDHRGRSDAQEGASDVQARDRDPARSSTRTTRKTKRIPATW